MEKRVREIELFVPGRLCLFGEHSDWAGRYTNINSEVVPGRAIVTGIDLGIYAKVSKSDRFEVVSFDEQGNPLTFSCDMNYEELKKNAESGGFFCYMCGVAAYLYDNYKLGGARIEITDITLPIKKGLSSSAAICVLVARAFNYLYRLHFSTNGEMQIAYRGEMLTSSRCGRLDQACAYGVRPVCMEFNGDDIVVDKLKVGQNLYWVFADLMASKDTKKILAELNKCYPFAQTEKDERLHRALGERNRELIDRANEAIIVGDMEKIGALMKEAQKMFDEDIAPVCPSELTAPKLHKILADKKVNELSYGGKGVGSQGDGTIQFIAKGKAEQQELVEYLNSIGLQAYAFTIPASNSVRKAIIPLAGFGTRMYPETRFVKKEFLPVIDENNVVKPVIMYLLEELEAVGMEEIILIIGEEEAPEFERIFKAPLSLEHMNKLPEHVRDYELMLDRIGKKIRFAIQRERKGFGHAVYQAREYLHNEPALLLLGDFIYKSNLEIPTMQQTINAYKKSGGKLTVAIRKIPLEDVVHYGILAGTFDDKRDYLMDVSEMAEKPSVEYAKDYLGVKTDKHTTEYYGTFGQYVLTPQVFDILERDIKESEAKNSSEEIQLTTALQEVCQTNGMTGVYVDGESYDVGIPKAYRSTMNEFGKKENS